MPIGSPKSWGAQANRAARDMAGRVDDTTGDTSQRVAAVAVTAARLLRLPTAALLVLPLPFVATTLVLGLVGEGFLAGLLAVVGVLMALVSAGFWGRRRRLLQATDDVTLLGDELRQLFNLTGRVDDVGRVMGEIGGGGGVRVLGRLRGVWRGVSLPGHWLDAIGELPRAKYFAPPKIGTTVWITMASLWLVPVSVVVALVAVVGSLASSI